MGCQCVSLDYAYGDLGSTFMFMLRVNGNFNITPMANSIKKEVKTTK